MKFKVGDRVKVLNIEVDTNQYFSYHVRELLTLFENNKNKFSGKISSGIDCYAGAKYRISVDRSRMRSVSGIENIEYIDGHIIKFNFLERELEYDISPETLEYRFLCLK